MTRRFSRRHIIATAITLVILATPFVIAYYTPGWLGPSYAITDGDAKDGCWEIIRIDMTRQYTRGAGGSPVIRTRPVYWDELTVKRPDDDSQLKAFPDSLPTGPPIPHGQTGTVDIGDVACTGRVSQLWLYTPREPPTPWERFQRFVHQGAWEPPIVVEWVGCYDRPHSCS